MLAFNAHWPVGTVTPGLSDSNDLAAALCSGIGGQASAWAGKGQNFAHRPINQSDRGAAKWQPVELPDGQLVAFHGWIDNAPALAAELVVPGADPASVYGAALAKWGEASDLYIVGEYCAIVADPATGSVRLSRSPLRAPPLLYAVSETRVAAASVPRAIFAAGFERQLNETRVADSAMINFTDHEAAWFVGLARVPLGCVVELAAGQPRKLRRYYDLACVPKMRLPNAQAYVERARELLDEAVAAVAKPFSRPGATLSSGLDSPQVVIRAARLLPPGARLPTFTFHPEPEWDGIEAIGTNGNERPMVEAFAAMHPAIEPHFTDNPGCGHDYRWDDLFRAMEGAPSGLCNMYVFHGLCDGARRAGCDGLLIAEWGNYTFSDKGDWAFVEYLLTGRWRQLWLALRHRPHDSRSMLRKFIVLCLVPLLPDSWWRRLYGIWHPGATVFRDLMTPLTAAFRARSGANRRLAQSRFEFSRYQPRSRGHARELLFANEDCEGAEVYQAFEQLYGVPLRDPMAYRPFVEFCFGLPTEMFMRDGVPRWLAKELGRSIMPEAQRQNGRNGRWDADWLLRIRRKRDDYRAELDRIADDPELFDMLDVPRLRSALDSLPQQTELDPQKFMPIEFNLMRGLLTARYVNHVRGRN